MHRRDDPVGALGGLFAVEKLASLALLPALLAMTGDRIDRTSRAALIALTAAVAGALAAIITKNAAALGVGVLLAAIALVASGFGARFGVWDYRFGFTLVRWSLYTGAVTGALALIALAVPRRAGHGGQEHRAEEGRRIEPAA